MSEFGTLYIAANQAAISYSTFVYTVPWSISLTIEKRLVSQKIATNIGKPKRSCSRQWTHENLRKSDHKRYALNGALKWRIMIKAVQVIQDAVVIA